VLAPDGTLTVILLSLFTVKMLVVVVLKVTELASEKLLPEIVTVVPAMPCAGVKLETIGGGSAAAVMVKELELEAVPADVVTVMGPLVADDGTVAVIRVLEFTAKPLAFLPLNFTELAPVNALPVITIDAPDGPLPGENELIVGPLAPSVMKL
jgi:hypothetical protein